MANPAPQTLSFIEQHEPALANGTYAVKVTQAIEGETFYADADFVVSTPRFRIDPGDIHSMFPPPASSGDHALVLPHIILRRSTLPWEHAAIGSAPWLALLLFDDGEILESGVKAFDELMKVDATLTINSGAGEAGSDPVAYIKVDGASLSTLMPSADDLRLLTHVRRAPDGSELAVIAGNRLPKRGATSTVHLVSVDSRYKDDPKTKAQSFSPATGDVILLSLATWRFSCDADAAGLHQMANVALATAPAQVRLRHRLRNGKRHISLYRGPFSATPPGLSSLPEVSHADGLLGLSAGELDVTYSAAWELGRLLTLRNKHVASQLYLWKCRHAQSIYALQRQVQHIGSAHVQLPPDVPTVVSDWFASLRLLTGVPVPYLIPVEALVPPESIRFFQVDARWIEQLQAGAFSVGHVAEAAQVLPPPPKSPGTPICGFIVRSGVVTQWPHLQIDASIDLLTSGDSAMANKLEPLRRDVISPGILLCLFTGDHIHTVDFHQKPEALHVCFALDSTGVSVIKRPRDHSGTETNSIVVQSLDLSSKDSLRRFDASGFKQQLEGLALGFAKITSAEFALAMVEGVERVRFTV